MSSGCHALEKAQVGQGLGDLLRQPHRLVAPQVDHLLGDAKLEQSPGQLEQLVPVLAVPSELERAPDFRGIAADLSAGGVNFLMISWTNSGSPPEMFQTSAWRAVSRSVLSTWAPIQIGGYGFCTGLGSNMMSANLT